MSYDTESYEGSERGSIFTNRSEISDRNSLGNEKNPLDDLTDQQLIDLVHDMEMEVKHLNLENIILMDYLENNDPSATEGLAALMDYAIAVTVKKVPAPFLRDQSSLLHSVAGSRKSMKFDSHTSISFLAEGKGPRINLSQKTDMILKAMEEKQSSLESFLKRSHRTKRNLRSELEEFLIRESDINEAREIFEYNIVIQGLDKLTQRIPAEKWVRYMDEWLKSAQFNIEKLRLRTASLKVQYKKVSSILVQRQELGENVHAVDFDQLEIENKHFLEKIEQKNVHLIELKKMNGTANLVLSRHKKYLQKQLQDYNKLKAYIVEQEEEIKNTENEYDLVKEEVQKAADQLEYFKKIRSTYKVPDVMEYVKIKSKLYDLKKNIKIWQRRKKIQDIGLNACLREMKNISGTSKVDPAWFQDPDERSVESD